MARNPTRIDYYERYQTIISNYNAEQNRAAIEKSFTDLLALANELDIETERYIREGFDNEEQLALFDLLKKGHAVQGGNQDAESLCERAAKHHS